MNDINLILKPLSDLFEYSFSVPSYQRGYRWGEQQVKDLLEDLFEFSKMDSNNGEFYCLQPLVVKKADDDKQYRVIDGQQRLTTLFILLTYLEPAVKTLFNEAKKYSISYETRCESYLENLCAEIVDKGKENIDYFHMYQAYETVRTWFADDSRNKGDFANLLMRKASTKNAKEKLVKFIWYEINDKNQNEEELFTRINMGKIPLTNAELIKAVILNSLNVQNEPELSYKRQSEIASEWDAMEYSLQRDDFWCFLGYEKKSSRIEIVFDVMAENYAVEHKEKLGTFSGNRSFDDYYDYHVFQVVIDFFDKDKKIDVIEGIWQEVKRIYSTLEYWFEDFELFHKIGYLRNIETNKLSINTLLKKSFGKSKTDFRAYINNQIIKSVKDVDNLNALNYESDKKKIRKILLLFNIVSIVGAKDSTQREASFRFQFDQYKDWDIEHVNSQTEKVMNKEDLAKWKEAVDRLPDNVFSKEKKEQSKYSELDVNKLNDSLKIVKEVNSVLDGESNTHQISNLALLNKDINRSYGNAPFVVKRQMIIDKDKEGAFIPMCTKNLFLKYYSKNPDHFISWSKTDGENYLDAITTTLENYLNQNSGEKNDN